MLTKDVLTVAGVGGIGLEIARRLGPGRIVLVADVNEAVLAESVAVLEREGFDVVARTFDVTSQSSVEELAAAAADLGRIGTAVLTAGGLPSEPRQVIATNMLGAALFLDSFGRVIAPGGTGLVIGSMSGQLAARIAEDDERALATAPVADLLTLPVTVAAMSDTVTAYRFAKRANSLRVQSASVEWGRRGARVNVVSPGVIQSPLTIPALASDVGDGVRDMIAASAAGRIGTATDVANAAVFLTGPDSAYITGADLLVDGGAVAGLRYPEGI